MLAVVPTDENVFIPAFDDFWCLYPKRIARKEAQKAWLRLTADERVDAVIGLSKWRRVWIARGEMQYVPNGATWINGARWEDELPVEVTSSHASHALREVTAPPDVPRVIPDDLKALIARMKAK